MLAHYSFIYELCSKLPTQCSEVSCSPEGQDGKNFFVLFFSDDETMFSKSLSLASSEVARISRVISFLRSQPPAFVFRAQGILLGDRTLDVYKVAFRLAKRAVLRPPRT